MIVWNCPWASWTVLYHLPKSWSQLNDFCRGLEGRTYLLRMMNRLCKLIHTICLAHYLGLQSKDYHFMTLLARFYDSWICYRSCLDNNWAKLGFQPQAHNIVFNSIFFRVPLQMWKDEVSQLIQNSTFQFKLWIPTHLQNFTEIHWGMTFEWMKYHLVWQIRSVTHWDLCRVSIYVYM